MQPRLMAIETAVPPFVLEQGDVAKRVEYLFGGHKDITRMMGARHCPLLNVPWNNSHLRSRHESSRL